MTCRSCEANEAQDDACRRCANPAQLCEDCQGFLSTLCEWCEHMAEKED